MSVNVLEQSRQAIGRIFPDDAVFPSPGEERIYFGDMVQRVARAVPGIDPGVSREEIAGAARNAAEAYFGILDKSPAEHVEDVAALQIYPGKCQQALVALSRLSALAGSDSIEAARGRAALKVKTAEKYVAEFGGFPLFEISPEKIASLLNEDAEFSIVVPQDIDYIEAMKEINSVHNALHFGEPRSAAVYSMDFAWLAHQEGVLKRGKDLSQPRKIEIAAVVPGTEAVSQACQVDVIGSRGMSTVPLEDITLCAAVFETLTGLDLLKGYLVRGAQDGVAVGLDPELGYSLVTIGADLSEGPGPGRKDYKLAMAGRKAE